MIKLPVCMGFVLASFGKIDISNMTHNVSLQISDTQNTEPLTSKIVIVNYYFGRKQYITEVTTDSIISRHDNFNGNISVESRNLTEQETAKLIRFLWKFPPDEIKEQYADESVEDGAMLGFYIRINEREKKIHVSNVLQKDLAELVEKVSSLLKEDYIGYK